MNSASGVREGTFLSELMDAFQRAAEYNPQDQVAPAAILWTDKERQWESLAAPLREALPHFLTLGPYVPKERSGPAIWVKCMLARTLPEANWPEGTIPILYLPGVSRHELRAVEECPRELQPLAELQFRGVWFTQENTRDWTVFAFLTSKRGGLELDIADDGPTHDAMLPALGRVADTPVAELRGRRLHAADFRALLRPDPVRDLLRWLDAPTATRQGWKAEEWQAFCGVCSERYDFDPEKDGELVGAERLGAREGSWDLVWERFAEAPEAYPNLPELLRRAKPPDERPLFFRRECYPQCNEAAESKLRTGLYHLSALPPEAAAAEIEKLESAHAARREWVWARLGRAPLARAMVHLALLAHTTRTNPGGENAAAMAAAYADEGWRTDAAVLDALAEVTEASDVDAVKVVIQAVYKPWLEVGAERFQDRVRQKPAEFRAAPPIRYKEVEAGTCIIFADGLRLDLGKRLRTALEAKGCVVEEGWRWVPLPTVTPTAKPVASPVADLVTGAGDHGEQFLPSVRATGEPLTTERFRRLLGECGFDVLRDNETGNPVGRGWTEHGEIDQRGHNEGWKLARRIEEEMAGLVERIRGLLNAGWREVRVVTDHGWLLVPGGLPKVEVPQYLLESRWTRCGTLKPGARIELPTAEWYWNPDVQVVLAPGIGSFLAGTEYSHGGLTLQECVVLSLEVRLAEPSGPAATVESVRWTGLRCRVQVAGAGEGCRVDLRTKAGDPASSLALHAHPQPVDLEGDATLVVDDPEREGTAAAIVLLDPSGRVVGKRNTTVGGEE